MSKIKQRKYKGFGFAEALVALMVSGVVGIILLSISATAIAELRKIEVQDLLAQYAVNSAIQLQKGAMDSQAVNDFLEVHNTIENNKLCYQIDPNGFLITDEDNPGEAMQDGLRVADYEDNKYLISDEQETLTEFFRYACIGYIDPNNRPKTLVMDIIVGSIKFKGKNTTDNDIKDFKYVAVINI